MDGKPPEAHGVGTNGKAKKFDDNTKQNIIEEAPSHGVIAGNTPQEGKDQVSKTAKSIHKVRNCR